MLLLRDQQTPASRLQLRLAPRAADGRGVELAIRLARDPLPGTDRIDALIAGGSLRLPIELVERAGEPASAHAAYFRRVCFALRDRQTTLATADGKGERPHATLTCALNRGATLDVARALAGRSPAIDLQVVAHADATLAPLTFTVPLADLARDAEGGLDTWTRLLSPDPETGALRPLPRRYRGASRGVAVGVRALARDGDGFASLPAIAALTPMRLAPAGALARHPALVDADAPVPIVAESRLSRVRKPHMPLLDDDPDAELWTGADSSLQWWYLPVFVVVRPDPSRPASESPFTFRFRETGHNVDGRPGIDAVITITLRRTKSDAVAATLAGLGNPAARAVPFQASSVSLSIPFRDRAGQLRRELFTATTVENGDTITATIPLINDWARLAYGAIAVESFQSEPARVQIAGHFEGAREELGGPFPRVLEPIREQLPAPLVHRDGGGVSFATPSGTIVFARPDAAAARGTRPLDQAQLVAIHGQLHGQAIVARRDDEPIFSEEFVYRTREATCLLPCERFGAFYIEETDEGDVPVGCRNALKLGEADYRLYAPVEDARLPASVQVFRSLLQPGRFLLVPTSYQVARFGADAGERAYHPAIFLYSSLDPAAPENNRAALLATLGPAVAAHEVEQVRELLRELSPAPVMQFITEIPAKVSYSWSLPNGEIIRNQQAIRRFDSFQVSMAVDLAQAPLLEGMLKTSGLAIVATFALPDGTSLHTALDLDLNTIVGPLGRTPADVVRAGGGVALTNRIDVDVDVDDLLIVDDAAAPGRPSIATLPVQKTLAPGERIVVAGDVAASARLVPVATPARSAAALQEIRSFVEDVIAQMAFINLIAFDNHGVSRLAIDARVKDTHDAQRVTFEAADAVRTLQITLPLTTYLAHPVVQFQASVTPRSGAVETTAWIDWPLETKGNVVGVSWELLGLAN